MKKTKKILMLTLFAVPLFSASILFAQDKQSSVKRTSSLQAVQSFIKLHPDSIIYQEEQKSRRWNYEQGLILEALYKVYLRSGDEKIFTYIKKNLDYYIQPDGSIKTYSKAENNLDNVTPGKVLLRMYEKTGELKYAKATDTLRDQLSHHPRTKEGGFWHKEIYPHQMWLDGLYMAEPFYAAYSETHNDTAGMSDVVKQFKLIAAHAKDPATGLFYHGWDESKEQKWANPSTGTSPNFWSRSIGWYIMALADVLEIVPDRHPEKKDLIKIFQELSESLLTVRDTKTKLWFQVMDKPDVKGNYIETSGSLMNIYAFAKGYNEGYLSEKFLTIAGESFDSLCNLFTFEQPETVVNLNNTVRVSGLGGKPYRDGSVSYYLSETVRVNDMKGYGPFILAALELEESNAAKGKVVALDNYFNREWKNGVRYHYVWEETAFGGFSEWGKTAQRMGANLKTIYTTPSKESLDSSSVYIIVDPDTPAETEKPNYIDETSICNIKNWVSEGGVLLLMANDSANCEFKHLNNLAGAFGLHYDENSINKVTGSNFEMGAVKNLPSHPVFNGVKKIYLKEISTISVSVPVDTILFVNGKMLIAGVSYGKGYVCAIGDPWLYNEYFDTRKLPTGFENNKAGKNLIYWLLEKSKILK